MLALTNVSAPDLYLPPSLSPFKRSMKEMNDIKKIKKIKMFFCCALLAVLAFAIPSEADAVLNPTGKYIRIALQNHSCAPDELSSWKCEISGEGGVEQITMEEYFELAEPMTTLSDGTILIPDMPVPGGVVEFYFRASRPGFVNLRLTRGTADALWADANFRVAVFSDLKAEILERSEKYDWPTDEK
ncbi:hypothetical protein FACS1894187_22900 [Synergistales bacterium]|nr:hypothetical protein FACS1894187_22900 [Synergistales bacterium]